MSSVITFHREKTVYAIHIYHGPPGTRRAVIYECHPNGEETLVADFSTWDAGAMSEDEWLERFGKRPYRAFRRLTSSDEECG